MSAYLDSQRSWGERNGGVSDPRLVRQVDSIHPLQNTTEELAAARQSVLDHSQGHRDHAVLTAMIFPPALEAA